MNRKIPFYIMDVFAEQRYAGNPLAVFRRAGVLASEEMLKIAREIHFSETTFILSDEPNQGGYDVRIFTPGEEVPFAGHPTLGTAQVILQHILGKAQGEVTLNLQAGRVPVTFGSDGYGWMRQVPPVFGAIHSRSAFAAILGLEEEDLVENFPVQEVSTGLPFFIVPLRSLSALKQARINHNLCFDYIEHTTAKGILVFCAGASDPQNDISVRVFVDYYGVPEDPATGSGNGCLAAYLVQHCFFRSASIRLRSEQGIEIGRPSLLLLDASQEGQETVVKVGGRSIVTAQGEWQ